MSEPWYVEILHGMSCYANTPAIVSACAHNPQFIHLVKPHDVGQVPLFRAPRQSEVLGSQIICRLLSTHINLNHHIYKPA